MIVNHKLKREFRKLLTLVNARKRDSTEDTNLRNLEKWSYIASLANVFISIAGLLFIYLQIIESRKQFHGQLVETRKQLETNNTTNKVSYRGQLYEQEDSYNHWAIENDELNGLWMSLPDTLEAQNHVEFMLKALTADISINRSKNPKLFYNNLHNYKNFTNEKRRKGSEKLRRLYLYAQSYLYHVHNAYDYMVDSVLTPGEFDTWSGFIRQIGCNLIFLTAIWDGYEHDYMSRDYAVHIQKKLLDTAGVKGKALKEVLYNRKVVAGFYPEILDTNWSKKLPAY